MDFGPGAAAAISWLMDSQKTGVGISGWKDLIPEDFTLGSTKVSLDTFKSAEVLTYLIPEATAIAESGKEHKPQGMTGVPDNFGKVSQVKLNWKDRSNLLLVRIFLSARSGRNVSEKEALEWAQKAPQALEMVKGALKEFKEHINRLCSPIAIRRDPKFLEVALRYKEMLREVANDLQEVSRRRAHLTAKLNKLLAERDGALHELDPGYQPKRVDASAALKEFGFDVADAELEAARERSGELGLGESRIDNLLDF
jgi:hypothetical protein